MAQEEHSQRCSNYTASSGGGGGSSNRSLRRLKQKKVPQRGLGVAKLEKIRLEEQRKKDAALQAASILPQNPIISPSNSSSCLAIQGSSFRPDICPTSITLRSPSRSPISLPSSNSQFRPALSIPNVDILNPNSVPLFKSLTVGGGDHINWSAIPSTGQGNLPKLWSAEYKPKEENLRLEHDHGFKLSSNMHFPDESNSRLCSGASGVHRSQLLQISSSMVNGFSGKSARPPSSSCPPSIINFQIEPPSNQSYSGNYSPLLLDENGRPYPFSLENASGTSSRCKFPQSFAPVSWPTEFASCNKVRYRSIETACPREDPPSSCGVSELNLEKVMEENRAMSGDFLTLAPPALAFHNLNHKRRLSSSNVCYSDHRLLQMEPLPHHGSITKDVIHQPGRDGSTQQPIFSFFPSTEAQIEEAATRIRKGNGEVGKNVDLNLKL